MVRNRPASPRRRFSTSIPAGPFRGRGRRFLQLALLRGNRPLWLAPGSCSDNPRRIRFPAWLSGRPVDRLSGTRESAFSDRPHAPSTRRAGQLAFPTWKQTRDLQPSSLVVLARKHEDPIRELVRVYLTNPAWQKHFPDAMSPSGWKRLTHWLRERYSLDATGCDYQSHSPLRPYRGISGRLPHAGSLGGTRCLTMLTAT